MGKNLAKKISNLSKIPHPKGRKAAQLSKKTIRNVQLGGLGGLSCPVTFTRDYRKNDTEILKTVDDYFYVNFSAGHYLMGQPYMAIGRKKIKLLYQVKVNVLGEKLLWFKENLDSVRNYSPELTINLIEKYLKRFDEELEQINLKHTTGKRKSRQHASREDIIKMTIKNERNEFLTCGIEMPDVLNPKQLDLLRNWSGELRYIQNFKLVRYSKGKLANMMGAVKHTTKEKEQPDHLDEKQYIEDAKLEAPTEGNSLILMDLDS